MASVFQGYGDNIWDEPETEAEQTPAEETSMEEKRDAVETDDDPYRALGIKLGLIQQKQGDEDAVEPEAVSPEGEGAAEVPQAEANEEEPTAFSFKTAEEFHAGVDKYIESVVGLPLTELAPLLADLGTYINEQRVEQQKVQLRQAWGEDGFEDNYNAVVEKYKTLPPDLQAAYDNVEGAKLIFEIIQREKGQTTSVRQKPPAFDRKGTGSTATSGKYLYTQSEIEAMSSAEYRKNAESINDAYARGLVDTKS